MTDLAAIVGISALCMVLIAVITSSDFPMPSPLPRPRGPRRNALGAIELPSFGAAWCGLYDGLDVPEHLRRALPPSPAERPLERAPIIHAGPYR